MAKGAGIHLGLSFIIKDIKCGWLNAAGFEGSRVKYLEHKILFQLSKIKQCCDQLHSSCRLQGIEFMLKVILL